MGNNVPDNEVQAQIKHLLSIMKKCKKILTAENDFFQKNNSLDVSKSQRDSYESIEEFTDAYDKILRIRGLASKVPEKQLQTAAKEHDELMTVLKEYMINLEATSKIQELIMGSIKDSKSKTVQKDQGYNKSGKLAKSQELLSNMPSVAFNSKL